MSHPCGAKLGGGVGTCTRRVVKTKHCYQHETTKSSEPKAEPKIEPKANAKPKPKQKPSKPSPKQETPKQETRSEVITANDPDPFLVTLRSSFPGDAHPLIRVFPRVDDEDEDGQEVAGGEGESKFSRKPVLELRKYVKLYENDYGDRKSHDCLGLGAVAFLVHVSGTRYIYIGEEILAFDIPASEPVLKFYPYLGNSTAIYPWVVTPNRLYLLIAGVYLSRKIVGDDCDPYSVYYWEKSWYKQKGGVPQKFKVRVIAKAD